MAAIINTNIASLNAQRNLTSSQSALQTSLQRLSSGLRINSAKDDAAGLAISERFSTQIRGLNQAARNANDGISLAQTGEGALSAVTDNLQRIRELAVQAANSTNSADDRAAINLEVAQRLAEIDRTASQTSFNGTKLLDGSFSGANFQIGANAGEVINVSVSSGVRLGQTGAIATATTTAFGASGIGGRISTGALDITAVNGGDFSQTATTAGSLSINPATRNFGTAAQAFSGGSNAVNTVATTDFSVVGTELTSGSVSFTASDNNFQAFVGGKSAPLTVTSFDNDGTSPQINGYNSQVPTGTDFSGAGLAQFNVTDGTNTASITLTTTFADMTDLATELQNQLQAGGGALATATVAYDADTGGLKFTNSGIAALQVANVDANAVAAGFANSAGVAGAAQDTAAVFTVGTVAITMDTDSANITGFAADLTTKMQASALGADYSAAVVNGKIVITNAGGTGAVDISAANAKALASGITNVTGVAGIASSNPSTLVIDGLTVELNQNYGSYSNMAAAISTQLGSDYTVTSDEDGNGTHGDFKITRVDAGGVASTAIDITGDANSDTAGITAGGARAGTAGTDLVAGTNVTFNVGSVNGVGGTAVTLNTDLGDRTSVLLSLQSQLTGYNVTDTGTGYTFTSLTNSDAVEVSADLDTAQGLAAKTLGFVSTTETEGVASTAGVAGTAAVNTTNATMDIDGLSITLDDDYGSFDLMAADLALKLNAERNTAEATTGVNYYTVANDNGAFSISRADSEGATSLAIDITNADSVATAVGLGNVTGVDGADKSSVDLTIDGKSFTLDADYSASTLTNVAADLQSKLNAAGPAGFGANAYTVEVNDDGDGLNIRNNTNGSAAVAITVDSGSTAEDVGFVTGSGTAGAVGGSVSLSDLTINGTSMAGSYGSSTVDGMDALATAINATVGGVYATVSGGALTLSSAANITLGGATDTTTAGLAVGTIAAESGSLMTASVLTVADANMTIQRIDAALNTVSNLRSTFGAIQNRFESVISSLSATSENLTAARSRIQDTDFAAETAQLTRNQILQQAGTAMLAQANQLPNTVLSLLR